MRKKLWAILMTIMMIATMMPTTALTAFAEETGGDMGEGASDLIISGTKVWDDGNNPDRPESIKVTLTQKDSDGGVVKTETKTVSGAKDAKSWSYDFNITDWSLVDANGNKYTYEISENENEGYVITNLQNPEIDFEFPSAGEWEVDEDCSTVNILMQVGANVGDENTIIACNTTDKVLVIWAVNQLSDPEIKAIEESLKSKGFYKGNTIRTEHIFGAGSYNNGAMVVDFNSKTIKMSGKNVWTNVAWGTYTRGYKNNTVEASFTNTLQSGLTITAEDATKVYDGKALTNGDYKVTGLKEGHKIESGVEVQGTIVNVGDEENKVVIDDKNFKIVDEVGKDVTKLYKVATKAGKLAVTPRKVTLTSASDSKTYDGTALTNGTVTVGGDGFVGDEGATYDVTGSQTNVGNSPNTFTYTLNENTKADNYTITKEEGTLKVTPITTEIVITADSNTKVYDGTALTDSGYTYTKDVLIEGDELTAVVTGTQTNAGTSANKVTSYKVMRGNKVVTANYTFGESVDGTLTVTKRPVTLTSATDSKTYDGTALTNHNVTVGDKGFVTGEGATYAVTGSQLDAGTSNNTFKYTLNDGTKADNYEIETVEGTLTVTKAVKEIVIKANSAEKEYDGTPLTDSGYTANEGDLIKGDVLTDVVVTGSQIDAGPSANVVTSYKVMRGNEDVTNNYTFAEPVNGTLTVIPRQVTLTSATANKEYDGTPLTNDTVTVGGKGFVTGEGATYNVTGSQLDVGSSSNIFTYELNDGTKARNYIITKTEGKLTVTKVGTELVITANTHKKVYDGTALTDPDCTWTQNVLRKGDVLTAVAEGSRTDAGSSANVVKSYKIMRGTTDVTANYKIATADGTLTVAKRPVTLTSATASKVYDGKELTNNTVTVGGDGFAKDEGASYDVTGSQLDVGTSKNIFTYTLNEGTKADNYEITTVVGTLTVSPITSEIVITANSNEKVYDGTALTDKGYTYTDNILAKGDAIEAVVEGSQKDVGESANEVKSYKVMRGETDVTENYTFGESVDGKLTVTKRPVTLTSATDEKVYDGTALTNHDVTVGGSDFVKGEGATYDVTGSQLDVGSSKNEFTYKLNENTNADNYTITKEEGTLKVTPITTEIVITANSNKKVYDGKALTDAGYTYTENVLAKGDAIEAVVEGSQTNVGESANEVKSYKVMRGETDVTGNYIFGKSVDGKLEVTKRPVILTSATDEKEYDGTPLTNDKITVSGDGFVEGEGAEYDVTGSQLDVGTSDNTFTYELNENTKADNYDIKTVEGTLTVNKMVAQIMVTAASDNKVYDGTPLTNGNYSYDETMLKNGDKLTAVVEGSQTDADSSVNEVTSVKVMRGETDVTENYNIDTTDGTLTVTKRPVTLTSATDSKEYDGTPLTNSEVTVGGDGFAEGEGASYDVTGRQLDVGDSTNTFDYALNDGTNADNYTITKIEGTLTVTQVGTEIVITANSNTKMYDGVALVDSEYTYTEDVLKEGDVLEAVVEGSQTDVGSSENIVTSHKVMRGEEDVTANYKIATAKGTLAVTPRTVALTSATDGKFYDGTPLTNDKITVSGDGFAEGEGLVYNVTGTVTNVAEGEVQNEFTYTAANGTNLDNYVITEAYGTLKIAPVVLTVTADSKTKVQGEENPELTGTITGFVNDEKAEDVLKGAAEYATTAEKDSPVGKYPITAGEGTLEAINGNYIFDYIDGTLTIVKAPVVDKKEPPKDGAAKTGDDFNIWLCAGIAITAFLVALLTFITRRRNA